ncbi:MAG: CorA family divalent cation transporter, partial [Calditrichota bacterium]
FLADLSDHIVQTLDIIEHSREMASGLLDVYLSMQSNRMNEVMKLLTIIATIFIPLSFLAGVYGMNFDTSAGPFNLPELSQPYGYIIFWITCFGIGGGLLAYFKRKSWL